LTWNESVAGEWIERKSILQAIIEIYPVPRKQKSAPGVSFNNFRQAPGKKGLAISPFRAAVWAAQENRFVIGSHPCLQSHGLNHY
jgi:hypothetical protein